MDLIVRIPDEIVPQLQAGGGDLSRRALEALAIEEYKSERLSKKQLRKMLGFETRFEIDAFLKAHNVYDGYTFEEIQHQVETMKELGF